MQEELDTCIEYYEKLESMQQACDQESEEIGDPQLASCCRHVEDYDSVFWEHMECILGMNEDEYMCQILEECAPGADPVSEEDVLVYAGSNGTDQDATGDRATAANGAEEDKGGGGRLGEAENVDDREDNSGCTIAYRLGSDFKSPLAIFALLLGSFCVASIIRLRRSHKRNQ